MHIGYDDLSCWGWQPAASRQANHVGGVCEIVQRIPEPTSAGNSVVTGVRTVNVDFDRQVENSQHVDRRCTFCQRP
jgi:hypothetical protein